MLWNKTIGRLKLLEELLALHRTSQLPEQVNFDVQQPKNFEKPDYQLIGRHLKRLISNTNKLLEVMDTFDKTFSTNIFLQNDMFKVDFPNAPAHEILQNDIIGSELSETFVNSRLHGISLFEHCSEKVIWRVSTLNWTEQSNQRTKEKFSSLEKKNLFSENS